MVSKFTLYPRMETNMYLSIVLFSKPIRPLRPLPLPVVRTPSPACSVLKELTVQCKIVQQKKPFNERKLNPLKKERVERVQGMIAAHEQGLRRLQKGRKQAIETRRALDRIMKRVALERAQTKESSNEAFSYLIGRQKEKQKELRNWVGSLKESGGKSRTLMQKMMSESVTKNSVKGSQDGGALGLRVETAVTARANDTESTGKSANERSRSNSDPRCQGNTVTSQADMMALGGINQVRSFIDNLRGMRQKRSRRGGGGERGAEKGERISPLCFPPPPPFPHLSNGACDARHFVKTFKIDDKFKVEYGL